MSSVFKKDDGLRNALADKMRQERKAARHTQQSLSAAVRMSPNTLLSHEKGRASMRVDDLIRVARVLSIPASRLLPETEVGIDPETARLVALFKRHKDAIMSVISDLGPEANQS